MKVYGYWPNNCCLVEPLYDKESMNRESPTPKTVSGNYMTLSNSPDVWKRFDPLPCDVLRSCGMPVGVTITVTTPMAKLNTRMAIKTVTKIPILSARSCPTPAPQLLPFRALIGFLIRIFTIWVSRPVRLPRTVPAASRKTW